MISNPLPKELEMVELWLTWILKDVKGLSHYKLKLSLNGEDPDTYEILTTYNESDKYCKNYTHVNFRESEESLKEELYKYWMSPNEFHFYDKGEMNEEYLIWKCLGSII